MTVSYLVHSTLIVLESRTARKRTRLLGVVAMPIVVVCEAATALHPIPSLRKP